MGMNPNGALTYLVCLENDGKNTLIFTNGADPGVYYYERIGLSPNMAYNLLEDQSCQGFSAGLPLMLTVTKDEFSWLTTYDPSQSRGSKFATLLNKAEKNLFQSPLVADMGLEFNNGASNGREKLNDTVVIFSENTIGQQLAADKLRGNHLVEKISTEELQKGFDVWLEKNPPTTSAKTSPAPT